MPFLAPGDLERAGLDGGGLVITNPLAAEESVLRTSLRPGLLRSIAHNESHRRREVALFEIGHVYAPGDEGEALPHEHERVSVILAGRDAPAAVDILAELCSWMGTSFTLTAVAARRSASDPQRHGATSTAWCSARSARSIRRCSTPTASPSAPRGSISTSTVFSIAPHRPRTPARYTPVSRFPSSDIDLAFEVDDAVTVDAVESVMRRAAGSLLVDLWLFDVFRGAPVTERPPQPGVHFAFTSGRSHAHRRRGGCRTRPASSTRCRQSCPRDCAADRPRVAPQYTYAGPVAAVRTPTANILRAVAFATAVMLLATACGGASSHYVVNKPAETYFKVPKKWEVTPIRGDAFATREFLVSNAWAVFFAPEGLEPDALTDLVQAPAPVGVALIGTIEQGDYDTFDDLSLRVIPYTDDAGEAAVSRSDRGGPQPRRRHRAHLRARGRSTATACAGYRMRYQIGTGADTPPIVYDQTKMIHDATHTFYLFRVTCQVACFSEYSGDIDTIFDSLRVRRDQK